MKKQFDWFIYVFNKQGDDLSVSVTIPFYCDTRRTKEGKIEVKSFGVHPERILFVSHPAEKK